MGLSYKLTRFPGQQLHSHRQLMQPYLWPAPLISEFPHVSDKSQGHGNDDSNVESLPCYKTAKREGSLDLTRGLLRPVSGWILQICFDECQEYEGGWCCPCLVSFLFLASFKPSPWTIEAFTLLLSCLICSLFCDLCFSPQMDEHC